MIRHLRLRRRPCLVLMLAVATSSGCINSEKFTSGRLPYGTADGLAAHAPHDPFLTGGAAQPNEQHVASTAPTTEPMNYAAAASVPTNPAQNYAAMPSGTSQMQPAQMQPPQYAMHAAPAGAPMTDMRQTAYTPSEANPFNMSPSASSASQPMPSQMPASPTGSAIEQISYEMPVDMPAEAVYDENPFAEVQGQPIAADQKPLPQIQPMHVATDAWQPSATSSSGFAGNEFLPPQ